MCDYLIDAVVKMPNHVVGRTIGGRLINFDEPYSYYLYECDDCNDPKPCQYLQTLHPNEKVAFPSSCPVGIKAEWKCIKSYIGGCEF